MGFTGDCATAPTERSELALLPVKLTVKVPAFLVRALGVLASTCTSVEFAVEAPTPAVETKFTMMVGVAPAARDRVLPVTPAPEKLQVTPFAGSPGQLKVKAPA